MDNYATAESPSVVQYDSSIKQASPDVGQMVHQSLVERKSRLESQLGDVNQALAMLDGNPHFANVLAQVQKALGGVRPF